jgi:LacI family transcriptional regulator
MTSTTAGQPVSVRDVAQLAGVSPGTVSNALNHPERVTDDTRVRVQNAIDKLGFVRNHAARQLRVGRSRMVGLVVLDMSNPFFTEVARGADLACGEYGTAVLVGNSDQDLEREARYLDAFEEQRVRGVLLSPLNEDLSRAERLTAQGIPVVLVDRAAPIGSRIPSVSVDDERGGWLAARHLIESGRRRLAFIGNSNPALHQTRDRLAGARRAVAGAADVSIETIAPPAASFSAGREAARGLIARPPHDRPDGIVCPTDVIALGVLHALIMSGIRVPDDIAITGYDDIETAETAAVPLTTVRQPAQRMGATAVRLLEELLEVKEPENRHVVYEPELIVRESS